MATLRSLSNLSIVTDVVVLTCWIKSFIIYCHCHHVLHILHIPLFPSFFHVPDGRIDESKGEMMMNVVDMGKFYLMCEKIQFAIEHDMWDGWIKISFFLWLAIASGSWLDICLRHVWGHRWSCRWVNLRFWVCCILSY